MSRWISILLVFTFVNIQAFAQNSPVRVEVETNIDSDAFKVAPCLNHGVLVFYETVKQDENQEKIWTFNYYDNSLKPSQLFDIPMPKDMYFYEYTDDGKYIYLNFYNEGAGRNETNLIVLKFDPEKEEFGALKGQVDKKLEYITSKAANNRVVLGFQSNRQEVSAYLADFKSKLLVNLEFENSGKNLLESIYIDPYSGNINLLVNNFMSRRDNQLLVRTYRNNGAKISDAVINSEDEEIEINSAEMTALNNNEFLIIGTYNNAASRSSELKNDDEVISAGVYASSLVNGKMEYFKYYNFLDFNNFYTYVNPAEVFKLKKKSGKKNDERDYSLNYRLLLHELVQENDQYVLLAEAYYPDYETISYIAYDYYGRSFPQTYTVFRGYEYFSGIITAFNEEGELLYDNGIKILDITTFELSKKLVHFFSNTDLIIAYTSSGKIASEIYDSKGEIVGQFEIDDMALQYKKDKLVETKNNHLIPWYDNYFLAYGYQEISNNSFPKKNKRTVFYLTKIIFE